MIATTVIGAVARRLPRGRTRIARAVSLSKRWTGGTVEFTDRYGYHRRADLSDEFNARLWTGATELPAWVVPHLRPGDVVIDIGAQVGALTAQFCKLVGPRGRVLAVEPIPQNVLRVRELAELNRLPQLLVAEVAASNTDGKADIRLPRQRSGSAYASFNASWIDGEALTVHTTTVDRLVADYLADRAVCFLKIDVEGHERAVIEGARRTLMTWQPKVLCEFNDAILRDTGSSIDELLAVFSDFGYAPLKESDRPIPNQVTDVLLCRQRGGISKQELWR